MKSFDWAAPRQRNPICSVTQTPSRRAAGIRITHLRTGGTGNLRDAYPTRLRTTRKLWTPMSRCALGELSANFLVLAPAVRRQAWRLVDVQDSDHQQYNQAADGMAEVATECAELGGICLSRRVSRGAHAWHVQQ